MNKENHPDAISYRIDSLRLNFFEFWDVIHYCKSKGHKLDTTFSPSITTVELSEDEATFIALKFSIKLTKIYIAEQPYE